MGAGTTIESAAGVCPSLDGELEERGGQGYIILLTLWGTIPGGLVILLTMGLWCID